jgi:uncharacterized protein YciI
MLIASTPHEDRLVEEHFAYLKRLTDRGTVLLAGRTSTADPSGFGIVVLTAASDEAAERVLNEDPAVRAGIFCADVFPFRIALVSEEILR